MTHNPNCPLCLAGAHAAGHPLPEDPEPDEPLAPTAVLLFTLAVLLIVAAWGGLMWLLVQAAG
ncbi:hypothetical protein ACGFW5_01195 [Streptomyces sp. NPDC048416]|uniref:hypothetical protein n=1 Tax=Streptomyces sp. NPDC048416 TaxID=3365546 RepID=UPI0037184EDC